MWRALPLEPRTKVARTIARSPWVAPVRALARPLPAWILFNATFVGWHIPAAYDATLTSGTVHALEHAMFFFIGLLFWARVIDPGPLRPRLVWPARIAYAGSAMVVGWLLAITLVIVQHPIYGYYAALQSRPGGISALTDQQLAAGVMWVPGSLAYTITFIIGFYRWLEPDRSPGRPRRRSRPEEETELASASDRSLPRRRAAHALAATRAPDRARGVVLMFSVRVPNTADGSEPPGSVPADTNPGPAVRREPSARPSGVMKPGAGIPGPSRPAMLRPARIACGYWAPPICT